MRFAKHTANIDQSSVVKLKELAKRLKRIAANPSSPLSSSIDLELYAQTDKNERARLSAERKVAIENFFAAEGVATTFKLVNTRRHLLGRQRPVHGTANGTKYVDAVRIQIEPRDSAAQKYFSQYKYMTVPHEVGHMLGLMDEYSQATDEMLLQKMKQDGLISPQMLQDVGGCIQKDDNQRLWAKLLQEFELVTPAFKTTPNNDRNGVTYSQDRQSPTGYQAATTSLMSAGFNVAPQHFLIIGLALQEHTDYWTQFGFETDVTIDYKGAQHKISKRRFMWRIEKV